MSFEVGDRIEIGRNREVRYAGRRGTVVRHSIDWTPGWFAVQLDGDQRSMPWHENAFRLLPPLTQLAECAE